LHKVGRTNSWESSEVNDESASAVYLTCHR
jgi:hypothetical protein